MEESRPPSSPLASRRFVAILALAIVALGALLVADTRPSPRPLRGDEVRYQAEAIRVAAGDFPPPDFVWPPLQSALVGGLFALFGPSLVAVKLFQAGLLLATGLVFRRLLLTAGLVPLAADAAAALLLLDPQVASFVFYVWPEVPHLFLLLAGVALLTDPRESRLRPLAGGVLLGLAILAKSLVGPFVPVLLAACAFSSRQVSGRWWRPWTALLGVLLAVVPVAVRNGRMTGTYGIANSGPFNVWVGLNDPSGRRGYDQFVAPAMNEYMWSSPVPAERNRIVREKIAAKLSRDGLLPTLGAQLRKQYVRLLDKESYFTDQLAGGQSTRRAEAPGRREALLRLWSYGIYGTALLLAGLGLALPGRGRAWQLPALFLAYNAALFLLLHVKTRYRIAFWPAVLYFAALSLDHAARREAPAARRLFLGGAVAALLLWLAFGP